METNPPTKHRLSGGISTPPPELQRLLETMQGEEDVEKVHALTDLPDGRFAYMIQTPWTFPDFPSYAVGTTDANITNPIVLLQFGTEWSAQDFYKNLIHP